MGNAPGWHVGAKTRAVHIPTAACGVPRVVCAVPVLLLGAPVLLWGWGWQRGGRDNLRCK